MLSPHSRASQRHFCTNPADGNFVVTTTNSLRRAEFALPCSRAYPQSIPRLHVSFVPSIAAAVALAPCLFSSVWPLYAMPHKPARELHHRLPQLPSSFHRISYLFTPLA